MAITSAGSLGSAGVNTTGGDLIITTGATAEAGHEVIIAIARDNATAGGDGEAQSEISGIVDSTGSNTYSYVHSYTNGASAGTSVTVHVWKSRLSSQLNSGGTITITKAADVDAAAIAWEFISDAALQVAGTTQVVAQDAAQNPASMAHSGLTSKEYLFFRAQALEDEEDVTAWTGTASYTSIGEKASSTTGSSDANVTIRGEFIIATGTGHTSDPSLTLAAGGTEQAGVFIAFEESAGGGGGSIPKFMHHYKTTGAAQ